MTQLRLIVEFPNDSPDYTHGFETGRVYQQMKTGETVVKGIYHTQNLELLMQMARNIGYSAFAVNYLKNDWVELTFFKNNEVIPEEQKNLAVYIESQLVEFANSDVKHIVDGRRVVIERAVRQWLEMNELE